MTNVIGINPVQTQVRLKGSSVSLVLRMLKRPDYWVEGLMSPAEAREVARLLLEVAAFAEAAGDDRSEDR